MDPDDPHKHWGGPEDDPADFEAQRIKRCKRRCGEWAAAQKDSKAYSYSAPPANTNKCNKFVADALTAGGLNPYLVDRFGWFTGDRIPSANEWAAGTFKEWKKIPCDRLDAGDIIAFPATVGSGHVGVGAGNGNVAHASGGQQKIVVEPTADLIKNMPATPICFRYYLLP